MRQRSKTERRPRGYLNLAPASALPRRAAPVNEAGLIWVDQPRARRRALATAVRCTGAMPLPTTPHMALFHCEACDASAPPFQVEALQGIHHMRIQACIRAWLATMDCRPMAARWCCN